VVDVIKNRLEHLVVGGGRGLPGEARAVRSRAKLDTIRGVVEQDRDVRGLRDGSRGG
jgi:hypothetical protein